jgi:hypothetical protein
MHDFIPPLNLMRNTMYVLSNYQLQCLGKLYTRQYLNEIKILNIGIENLATVKVEYIDYVSKTNGHEDSLKVEYIERNN